MNEKILLYTMILFLASTSGLLMIAAIYVIIGELNIVFLLFSLVVILGMSASSAMIYYILS